MKSLSVSTFCIVLIFCFAIIPVSGTKFVKLDVKTKFSEKAEFAPIKAGAISALKTSNWCKVVNTGEDYSFWITECSRALVDKKGRISVQITVELRTPSMFRSGDLLERKTVKKTYSKADLDAVSMSIPFSEFFGREMANPTDAERREGMLVGKLIEDAAKSMVAAQKN